MAADQDLTAWKLDEIRRVERDAIASGDYPAPLLMERAGRAAFRALRQRWPLLENLLVVCGAGNNGGDGYLVAGLAREAGLAVQLFETSAQPRSDEATRARQFALKTGVQLLDRLPDALPDGSLVVDALLGIGFSGELREREAGICRAINRLIAPCFSLDVPSGVNPACGSADPDAVHADMTISFIGLKAGLLTGSAAAHAGQVITVGIGIGDQLSREPLEILGSCSLSPWLQPAPADSHKGRRGTCLVIGGAEGMAGAAMLAAQAALMTGVGKVRLACGSAVATGITGSFLEVMAVQVTHYRQLLPLLEDASSLVVGPGLGRSAWSQQMLYAALQKGIPTLLDADALRLLKHSKLKPHPACLLTPHPGEAADLLGKSGNEIQQDRFSALNDLVAGFGCATLLKGNGSIVASPEGGLAICRAGSPSMARAGMGDVLSGIVGGLLARRPESGVQALKAGTWLHAAAADQLLMEGGDWSVLPSRLVQQLPAFVRQLES